jgi:glycosyltransferase involved in cell wall biosynthesis
MSNVRQQRVSAIIPTLNRADFLEGALNAILSQLVPPDEIIVIDDGSTDHTDRVLQKFSKYIRSARIKNSGAPVARNAGAYLATGDWLWFCDSDDIWSPLYLSRVHGLLNASPQPRFVFGNFRLVRQGVWDTTSKFESAPHGFWDTPKGKTDWIVSDILYERLLTFQPIFHSTLVVSRDLFDTIGGYNPGFARTGSEDFEFILRCASHAPAGVVGEALVGIRRHGGNFSADQLHNLLGEIAILRYARAHHAAAAGCRAAIDDQIVRRSLQSLELAFSAGNYELVRSLTASLKPNPAGLKPQIKMLLAAMPPAVRDPIVALATRRMP